MLLPENHLWKSDLQLSENSTLQFTYNWLLYLNLPTYNYIRKINIQLASWKPTLQLTNSWEKTTLQLTDSWEKPTLRLTDSWKNQHFNWLTLGKTNTSIDWLLGKPSRENQHSNWLILRKNQHSNCLTPRKSNTYKRGTLCSYISNSLLDWCRVDWRDSSEAWTNKKPTTWRTGR